MTTAPRSPVLPVLGFAAAGLFSFGLACVVLLAAPELLAGDPVRGPVLALTHLVTIGWIGSLLFAAAYLAGPMLARSELWSRKLAAAHLALHLAGFMLLVSGLVVLRYDIAACGAGALVAGLALMVGNLVVTGSRPTDWNPAHAAFQTAMFWLAATGALALVMLHGRLAEPWLASPETLIVLHAHVALFGFLAQVLLAVSLEVVPLSLGQTALPPRLHPPAWTAWAVLNSGLMLLLPASLAGSGGILVAAGAIVTLGIALFATVAASILWMFRDRISWGAATYATGIAMLAALSAAVLWRLPEFAAGKVEPARGWMRLYISLALLGPFSFAIIGTAGQVVPRLVWALRFGPWAAHGPLPSPASLGRKAAAAPAYVSLLMAWVYFALGQGIGNSNAIRLGAVLMLLGFGWFLAAIAPAIVRLVAGVTPADLQRPPPARAAAQSTPPSKH